MLKSAALLFNSLVLLIYQFFFADVITITQKVPASAKADTEFTVELNIVKGTTTGFAKLQQDLPEGFTAMQDENNGAAFTFANQSVKFIWMSLPADQEFKIKYKVKIAAGVSGDKVIAGRFSYVSDNVKQTIDIDPSTIVVTDNKVVATAKTVTPTPVVTETSTPAVTETTTPPVVETTTPAVTENTQAAAPASGNGSSVNCVRKIPATVGLNFTVEIIVNKGNMTGFAKLLETLPAGFTATAGDSKGASFTFTDQRIKFVWVSMPVSPEFKVSYNVSALPTVTGNQTINGSFSFIENDETKKSIIPTSTFLVSPADNTLALTETKKEPVKETVIKEPVKETVVKETVVKDPVAIVDNTKKTTETVIPETTKTNSQVLSAKTIPAPQGDVNYRIQIAALHRAIEAKKLADRYHLDQTVNTEMAEGFTKYTVGQHSEYLKARDARETVKSKGVVGPFVTAYNSGKRITVQEALMITSQKWYK